MVVNDELCAYPVFESASIAGKVLKCYLSPCVKVTDTMLNFVALLSIQTAKNCAKIDNIVRATDCELNQTTKDAKSARARVDLQPGCSLVEWIRFSDSYKRPKWTNNGKREVDHSELSRHSNTYDCWILLANQVYNVTDYLRFHPGGVDELMRAAGTDATQLFTEVHCWVNYKIMLEKFVIGPFVGDRSQLKPPKDSADQASTSSVHMNLEASGISASGSLSGELRLSSNKWINLRSEHVSMELKGEEFSVSIRIPKVVTCRLQWRIVYHTAVIKKIHAITHDVFAYKLKFPDHCRLSVPVGQHVLLRMKYSGTQVQYMSTLSGSYIERPYTPVMISEAGDEVIFWIKIYHDGIFTSKSKKLKKGDVLQISDPLGSFDAYSGIGNGVLMLAAGTGITPMLRFAAMLLNEEIEKKIKKKIAIILFNKHRSDIISEHFFDEIGVSQRHPSLRIVYCLSDQNKKWNGEKGFVSKDLIERYIGEVNDECGKRVFICGPEKFIVLTNRILEELSFPVNDMHIFSSQ